MLIIAGLAYYLGYLEGQSLKGSEIVLSCPNGVLSELQIPVENLAKGEIATNQTNLASSALASATLSQEMKPQNTKGQYVGSKNGTKYYRPTCGTVKRIKPENYVWFIDEED